MALIASDRQLVQRCLAHDPGSWNDFVDRFLGLIYHTINYTSHLRSTPLTPGEVEDVAQVILTEIASNDYTVLKQFHGKSSLPTYLTVIARRKCVQELLNRGRRKPLPAEFKPTASGSHPKLGATDANGHDEEEAIPERTPAGMDSLERVQKLIRKLPTVESNVVRMFYLEGRGIEEISGELNIPVSQVESILHKARKVLRPAKANKPKPSKPTEG